MNWWKKWKRFSSLHASSSPVLTSLFSRSTEHYLQHEEREYCMNTDLVNWWKMCKRFSSLHVCSFPFMTSMSSRTTEEYLWHEEREECINAELINWWKMTNSFLHCWFYGNMVWCHCTFWKWILPAALCESSECCDIGQTCIVKDVKMTYYPE